MNRSLDWVDPTCRDWVTALGLRTVNDAWSPALAGIMINDRGDRQVLRLAHSDFPSLAYLKRWRFPEDSKYHRFPGASVLRKRARAELRNLRKLARIGVVCPRPLAFGEVKSIWGPVASALLLADLAGYESAADFLETNPEEVPRVTAGMARIVATLHSHGLFYRSPGLKHFYVPLQGDKDQPFGLIDVPRLDRKPGPVMRLVREAFNLDTPGVTRDLSKVLMGVADHLERVPEAEECFWHAYFDALPQRFKKEGILEEVRSALEKRTESRRLRAIRKSERGE